MSSSDPRKISQTERVARDQRRRVRSRPTSTDAATNKEGALRDLRKRSSLTSVEEGEQLVSATPEGDSRLLISQSSDEMAGAIGAHGHHRRARSDDSSDNNARRFIRRKESMQALLNRTDLARGRKISSFNVGAGKRMSAIIGSGAAAAAGGARNLTESSMEGKVFAMEEKLNALATQTQTMRGDMKRILELLENASGAGGAR